MVIIIIKGIKWGKKNVWVLFYLRISKLLGNRLFLEERNIKYFLSDDVGIFIVIGKCL